MRQTLTLALNDLRLFLVDRGNLIGLLLIPIVMTLVIGYVSGQSASGGPERVRVDVLDMDESEFSAQLIQAIREANSALALCPLDDNAQDGGFCQLEGVTEFDREWALARLQDETTLALIEIPRGFGADLSAFRPVTITYYSLQGASAPGYIQQAVDAAVQRLNGAVVASLVGSQVIASFPGAETDAARREGLQQALYNRAAALWETEAVGVDFHLGGEPAPSNAFQTIQAGLGQSVPGMGAMFVMFTIFGGMTALIQERKQGTLQRLAILPLTRAQLLGGKILARFLLGLLQFLVILLFGALLGMDFGQSPLALATLVLSYTLAITALSFAIGTRLENESQAGGLALLLSLVLAPLGGGWWPLEIVPEFMRMVGHISPVAWAMDGFNALIFDTGGLEDVLLPVGVLLAISLLCFGIAIRRFRYV